MSPKRSAASVVVLAGLEPLGRAGLLVDVETIRAEGLVPIGIATCSTAQDGDVARIEPVSLELLMLQLQIALEQAEVRAVKVGLVPNGELLVGLLRALPKKLPCVVDPVVRSSTGASLSFADTADYLRWAAPNVTLTPNVDELRWLAKMPVDTELARTEAARWLVDRGFGAVVVKGGHVDGPPVDWLHTAARPIRVSGKRLDRGPKKRGTGCRYASAFACALARGEALPAAARRAKAVVRSYLLERE